ncbi:MAG: hypothetical protein IJ733_07070 [Lachnospiraceae bacterium]|nr:hypothetical protein [Lachnospiraceae bacterium]
MEKWKRYFLIENKVILEVYDRRSGYGNKWFNRFYTRNVQEHQWGDRPDFPDEMIEENRVIEVEYDEINERIVSSWESKFREKDRRYYLIGDKVVLEKYGRYDSFGRCDDYYVRDKERHFWRIALAVGRHATEEEMKRKYKCGLVHINGFDEILEIEYDEAEERILSSAKVEFPRVYYYWLDQDMVTGVMDICSLDWREWDKINGKWGNFRSDYGYHFFYDGIIPKGHKYMGRAVKIYFDETTGKILGTEYESIPKEAQERIAKVNPKYVAEVREAKLCIEKWNRNVKLKKLTLGGRPVGREMLEGIEKLDNFLREHYARSRIEKVREYTWDYLTSSHRIIGNDFWRFDIYLGESEGSSWHLYINWTSKKYTLAEIDRSERYYDFQMTPEEIGETFEFETGEEALYFHEILIGEMKKYGGSEVYNRIRPYITGRQFFTDRD